MSGFIHKLSTFSKKLLTYYKTIIYQTFFNVNSQVQSFKILVVWKCECETIFTEKSYPHFVNKSRPHIIC